jgi:PAT family beta-lactamase induction signal transducer AmpG
LPLNKVVLRSNASHAADPGQSAGAKSVARTPWFWIPTLYLAEGLPFAIVTGVSVVLYKNLGCSNEEIAFYTSWLSLPWVLKPLWSPVVDILKTRRLWIWWMQLVLGAGFAAVALTLSASHFLRYSLAIFSLLAFSSATHDIAADGFYLLALTEGQQSFFSGIRNASFRVALICGQGLLVMLAGEIQERTGGNTQLAWKVAFAAVVGLFLVLSIYHRLILPKPPNDRPAAAISAGNFLRQFLATFASFFQKPGIGRMFLFLLFYRFGEAQLMKMVPPFLLDPRAAGGLGLTTKQVGLVYGTIGVTALLFGGIVGGMLVSWRGLRACLWPMVFIMHLPDAVFIYLSYALPEHLWTVGTCVALEQFGYGFGFTAYMLYMIYIARGGHQTAHYAICTGFMALGMMLPGMWSGWLQEKLGYPHFFIWVLAATLPGFIVTALAPLDAGFGKKKTSG